MSTENLASLMIEGLKTVGAIFSTSPLAENLKTYTYKTLHTFNKGDLAVVNVNGVFKVVTITEIHDSPQIDIRANYKYQWIVSKVDTKDYEALTQAEEDFQKELRKVEHSSYKARAKELLAASLNVEVAEVENAVKLLNNRL
jgi:hypothetical protein